MHKKTIFLSTEAASFEIKLVEKLEGYFEYVEYSESFRDFQQVEVIYVRFSRTIDREFLSRFVNCKFVLCNATGIEHIDEAACSELGIEVISLRGETRFLESITATAEFTWFLLLALARRGVDAMLSVRGGSWDRNSFVGMQLRGRTLGIAGLGRNGKKIAQYAKAFEMDVLAYDPYICQHTGVKMIDSLGEMCRLSDVVCITAVSNEGTRRIFDEEVLTKLRPHALVVNSARGEIVDEKFILSLLETKKIGGYATDVVSEERDLPNNPLIRAVGRLSNLLITPHIGGVTRDSWAQTEHFVVDRLLQLMKKMHS